MDGWLKQFNIKITFILGYGGRNTPQNHDYVGKENSNFCQTLGLARFWRRNGGKEGAEKNTDSIKNGLKCVVRR